jgi:hypothetical protein
MSLFSSVAGKLVILSSLVAVAVTFYLFRDGDRGTTIATILSFTLSAVATAFAIYTAHAPHRGEVAAAAASPMSRRAKMWTAAVLTVGVLVPASAWAWNRWYSDLDVRFAAPVEVREDRSSTVAPDIGSRWRGGELTFTPMLAPVGELSDCVIPSVLRVEPELDGQPGTVVAARHGEQVSINIPDGTRDVELGLRLDAPGDQDCVVRVAFRGGELHR